MRVENQNPLSRIQSDRSGGNLFTFTVLYHPCISSIRTKSRNYEKSTRNRNRFFIKNYNVSMYHIRVQTFNLKLKFARLMWHPYIRTRNSTFGFPGFLSIYVRFYRPFFKIHLRKIMTEQITQRFEFSMTKWTILDGWAVMRSDQPMRFSTIFKNILDCETQIYGIKSITNRIWFEIALIYWKPLFDCNWIL